MGIIVAASVGSLAQAAHAGPPPPAVPTDIAVPAGNKVFLVGHAVGLTTHFGGPTWQARDGSAVRGRREAGVTVDRTAIEWLRLAVASSLEGADGDRLVHTTFIQRIATTGGLMPPREVPYAADYYFWKGRGD